MVGITAAVLGALALVSVFALSACQRQFIYFPNRAQVAPMRQDISVQHIRTADGETLIAWYHAPSHPGEPILLYFDGNGGSPEQWPDRWSEIIEHGAGFLAVYYRGYSGSTGHPTEAGLHEDARAGYDWLIAHNYPPRDIVIHGFSLGSGVAVQLAAERPARALILEAPFTGVDDVARTRFSVAGSLVTDRFASREFIGRVHMPVLVVHGDADNTVPFAQGERLFALANEPKTFVRVPHEGHVTLTRAGLYGHIWSFLAEHPG